MATITKTVAVYKSTQFDWLERTLEVNEDRENDHEYVRVTRPVTVTFEELDIDMTAAQVKAVEAEIEKVKSEALKLIGKLENRKAELLALTHGVKE